MGKGEIVFKRLVSQGRQKVSLCGNGLNLHAILLSQGRQKVSLCGNGLNLHAILLSQGRQKVSLCGNGLNLHAILLSQGRQKVSLCGNGLNLHAILLSQGRQKVSLCGNGLNLHGNPVISLPHNKILNFFKFKAFAGDKIKATQKSKLVSKNEENMVEKGKKAGNQHFLLFPQCFQKALFTGS